jgi:predicted amidohydrolase
MGEEHLHYQSGVNRILIPMNDFIIYPVVCYDIRFPVWLNRTADFDFDVLLVVANWPERRAMQWKALLCARAIENQCYVIACNRVGVDGNGVNHSGDSCVISPLGEVNTP